MSAPRLQLALRASSRPLEISVAGVPIRERVARALSTLPEVERIATPGSAQPLRTDLATVELSGEGLPETSAFSRFAAKAADATGRTAWIWRGEPIAVYFPAGDPPGTEWPPERIASELPAEAESWTPVRDGVEARAAEDRLFAALGKPTDGFLSRLDRRVSTAISRRLARTRVTPNAVTWVSIGVGLAGAVALASAGTAVCVAGALLVWLSAILDGCDGEIARVKLLASEAGARLDLFGDHLVNFAVLAAIAVHVHRARPEGFAAAAVLLAVGVCASAWTVARLSGNGRSPSAGWDLAVERLASRDFVYLVIPLAALDRLDWFFWAAAVGSNVFWVALWAWHRRLRSSNPRDDASRSQSPA
jgi:phosphatidylglycerophosphate synthase